MRRILLGGVSAAAFALSVGMQTAIAVEPQATEPQATEQQAAGAPETTAPRTVERVVVTATGRSEQVFDVPLAMSVTSGAELDRKNVTRLEDIQRLDPALNIRQYGPGTTSFIIRGIVSQAQPTTGIYYGEAPLIGGHQTESSGDTTPGPRLLDMDRVEILKGPQGTLFGAGSMAGTIRAIPAAPDTKEFFGSLEGQAGGATGGNELYSGSAMLNVPLSSTLAVRGVVWAEDGGGFIDQRVNGVGASYENGNDIHVRGGRLSALFAPSDTFDVTAKYTRQKVESDGTSSADAGGRHYFTTLPTVAFYQDELEIADLTAHLDALGGTFTGVASYTDLFRLQQGDTTDAGRALFGFPGSLTFPSSVNFHGRTFELRYTSDWEGPFQLVVGAFYQRDKTNIHSIAVNTDVTTGISPCITYSECLAQGRVSVGDGLQPGDPLFGITRNHRTEQHAYYAQGEYELSDTLTATVGVRYFRAKLADDSTNDHDIEDYLFRIVKPGVTHPFAPDTQSKVSHNFSLAWEPSSNLTTYVRVASGFRIGGLNDAVDAARNFGVTIPDSYAPDSLWDYEIGAKAAFFDSRLLVDGAIFHIDWSAQQLPGSDPNGTVIYTLNAGSTDVDGVELSLRSQPIDGLSVDAGFTFVNAELAEDLPQEVIDGGNPGLSGDLIPNQPRWSASLDSEYSFPVVQAWEGYFGGSLVYRGEAYNRFESNPAKLKIPSATLLGLRMGVRSDRLDIGLIVDNVFNEYSIQGVNTSVIGSGLPNYEYVGRPRTISLRASTRF